MLKTEEIDQYIQAVVDFINTPDEEYELMKKVNPLVAQTGPM